MKLSIVTSMYFSEPFINEFYKRMRIAAERITSDWELVLVNDGSPDRSLEEARKLRVHDNRVRIVDLSRNFGHHKALLTGLHYATGSYIFLVDIDLEEEPELLNTFWDTLQDQANADVAYGVQQTRRGGWFERVSGRYFYSLFNHLSDIKIDEDLLMARLMTRRYVENLLRYQEADVIFAGVAALTGFKQVPVPVGKGHKRSTTYMLSRKIKIMLDVVTSFSAKPLVWMFYGGISIFATALTGTAVLLYQKLVLNMVVEGWTSVIISIWFFGGLILLSLGLIGLYVAKIFVQVKNRPFTIVREAVGFDCGQLAANQAAHASIVLQGADKCEAIGR